MFIFITIVLLLLSTLMPIYNISILLADSLNQMVNHNWFLIYRIPPSVVSNNKVFYLFYVGIFDYVTKCRNNGLSVETMGCLIVISLMFSLLYNVIDVYRQLKIQMCLKLIIIALKNHNSKE
jgi:hypothetical protein